MVNCQGCGVANPDDAIKCTACGRALQINCPVCGCNNSVTATLCNQCGRVLDNNPDSKESEKKLVDPVSEMFESKTVSKPKTSNSPKKAIVFLVLGLFIFALLYLSKICEGHPFILLFGGLLSGIIALIGLIELTFWFIDEKNLVDRDYSIENENFENDLPDVQALDASTPVASLEESDKDLETSSKASEKVAVLDMGTPIEAAPEQVVKSPTVDKHYDTLAEFLDDGIATEINDVKEKLAKTPDNYALMLKLAQLYDERGETENALANLEACIKHNPDSAEVYLFYGTMLRQKGRILEAQKAFEKALEINKFMAKAYYQLGLLEKSQKKLEHARDLFQKAIQLSPDDPYAHYQLGMTYKDLDKTDLAIMEVKRATVLHPTDSYGHSRLGQFYQEQNKYDLAVSSYSRAIGLKPKDAFVLEKLAEVMAAKGDHKRAIEIFQEALACQFHQKIETMLSLSKSLKAVGRWVDLQVLTAEILRLEPENYEAAYLMAYSVAKQGNLEEATQMFEALVNNQKATYESWLELGKLYQATNQPDKAIVAFTKATTGAPDQAGIWNNIGILLSNQKLYVDALKAFRKAASFDYSDQGIADNLKTVQKKVDSDASKVIESRKKQIEKVPDDIEAYLEMGKAYENADMPNEALMAYQKVLALNPKYIPGLMNYSELLRRMGKLKMAMRCYREIIKLEPNNLDAHLFMINANLNLGFVNEAYKYASTAEKLAPEDKRVRFFLGKIYFARGLAPRALKEFTTVADSAGDPDLISWAELMRRRLSRTNKE
ncbi:MAG: tetratricopeptide repeat protein [Candidatus Riflebacteria bacterium]|nr:tetratricopeptide repeat protein [Candidatus Riflebacteria bacterium]